MKRLIIPFVLYLMERLCPEYFHSRQKYVFLIFNFADEAGVRLRGQLLEKYSHIYPGLNCIKEGQIPVTHSFYAFLIGRLGEGFKYRHYGSPISLQIASSLKAEVMTIKSEVFLDTLVAYNNQLAETMEQLQAEMQQLRAEQTYLLSHSAADELRRKEKIYRLEQAYSKPFGKTPPHTP